MYNIGEIGIKPIQTKDSIEIFEVSAKIKEVGPGLHVHYKMEESFYIVEGAVQFTIASDKLLLRKGQSLSIKRGITHSWKISEKNTKMLLIFTPSNNQSGYFSELEKLHQQGLSWKEGITLLANTFDNVPVTKQPR